jgi:hypothetical protein
VFLIPCVVRYGDNLGEHVLQQTIRLSHVYTCLQELESWSQCEVEANEANLLLSNNKGSKGSVGLPALILTRGRRGALFGSEPSAAELESAWDRGLERLKQRLKGSHFDVCMVGVEEGGLRLPLYRPQAVSSAIELVLHLNSTRGLINKENVKLEDHVKNMPKTIDEDATNGLLQFKVL